MINTLNYKRKYMKLFKELNLHPNIQQVLDKLGFTEPTEIQAKAIPILSSPESIDFHGQAQTGTGKTLAFGIPLIQRVDASKNKVQSLIVAPTRELVLQICESLKPFAQESKISVCPIYGGVSMLRQLRDLERGTQIVVGTPGRLNDHLRRKSLNLKDLQVLVLDEADIMLDMGFKDEIDEILSCTPKTRKIWLFSATIKPGINDIKATHMNDVVTVRVSQNTVGTKNTKQYYCVAPNGARVDALCKIIDTDPEFYGFIFCPTKALTGEISEKLIAHGYNVNCLHGDMEQPARTKVIQGFRQKRFTILVATDVAARGIDIPDITHVINYNLPNDQESYVHRIGRTGRAGKTGIAITFINNSEMRKIKMLGSKFSVNIEPMRIPSVDDVLKVQLTKINEVITKLTSAPASTGKYTNELKAVIDAIPADLLKNVVTTLLYEKFFKKFDEIKPQSFGGNGALGRDRDDSRNREGSRGGNRTYQLKHNTVEIEIGLGSNDGVNEGDIENYLVDIGRVIRNDLSKIKVLRKKSFVILPTEKVNDVINLLQNSRLHGKRARVAIAAQ